MKEYHAFIEGKRTDFEGVGFEATALPKRLFDFQEAIVKWACKKGRAAIFADTGLGKTAMQTVWADQVQKHTGGMVLIVAPLCVAQQTVKEAAKFGVKVEYVRKQGTAPIQITNYEMLEHFTLGDYKGVVLDESSILKNETGTTRNAIIEACSKVEYRLSCTATPSPNDFMELGSQAEFLGIMRHIEMLATYFTHDGGETSKWVLKGHAKTKFWEWLSTFSIFIKSPADLGFDGRRYKLPELHIHNHVVSADEILDGFLIPVQAESLQERNRARKQTVDKRVAKVAEIIGDSADPWLVWCHLNDESEKLAYALDCPDVKGADSIPQKEKAIMAFTDGSVPRMVTKPSIAGFGMNWQHCRNMVFVGLSDSYEEIYQAIRRCYRFGQTKPVHVHIVSADIEGAVTANIKRKELQMEEMTSAMISHMTEFQRRQFTQSKRESMTYKKDKVEGQGFVAHLSDCVELAASLPADSLDFSVFSPPFASLYTYSNSEYDMGNVKDDDGFYKQFRFLVAELFRTIKPGRNVSFHCMNLPSSKQWHGYIGLRDFRGELIRLFSEAGFIFHSEVCIWKDPVTAMQRTKAIGLLYKQLKKDSCISRQGIPDYLVTMRKPGENAEPVTKRPENFPVGLWQKYASPVWLDINPSRTLSKQGAREADDERHICPLQLDVIERAIMLWSNAGDTVFSPFMGIGSEGYTALKLGRKFIGAELKESYFKQAVKNLNDALKQNEGLFTMEEVHGMDEKNMATIC
jgi:superfamily II DNA or RNA helicase